MHAIIKAAIATLMLASAFNASAEVQPPIDIPQCGVGSNKAEPELVFVTFAAPTPPELRGSSGSLFTSSKPLVEFKELPTYSYGKVYFCMKKNAINTREGMADLLNRLEKAAGKGTTPILLKPLS